MTVVLKAGNGRALIERGELLVITNDTAPRTAEKVSSSRAATTVVWMMQLALAAMFLMAGGSKLGGAQAMIALFDAIGWGQYRSSCF